MKGFSPLVRRYLLFSRLHPFYNVSVRRNSSSIPSQISSFDQAKVAFSNINLAPFKRYIQGQFAEPYGGQGKESLNLFSQTFSKTFASVANAHRLLLTESSDSTKLINTSDFLTDLFDQSQCKFQAAKSLVPQVGLLVIFSLDIDILVVLRQHIKQLHFRKEFTNEHVSRVN